MAQPRFGPNARRASQLEDEINPQRDIVMQELKGNLEYIRHWKVPLCNIQLPYIKTSPFQELIHKANQNSPPGLKTLERDPKKQGDVLDIQEVINECTWSRRIIQSILRYDETTENVPLYEYITQRLVQLDRK